VLKALFLDMDETLCDTNKANIVAKHELAKSAQILCGDSLNSEKFAERYVQGIYRQWTASEQQKYMQIIEQQSEDAFRVQLIQDLLADMQQPAVTMEDALLLQHCFDKERLAAFDFFPGIELFLKNMRKHMTLVVITNGPEFSQVPKVERVNLAQHVDHIIIGGQEKEQKPERSIFTKALRLAACENHEVIHIGDGLTPDIGGANASHIKSVWVRHNQSFDKNLGITPDYIVEHPDAIPGLVEQLLFEQLLKSS
jgi:N-acylneuraminate-9-phosphatase